MKKPARRANNIWGKWTPQARLTVTLICACGNKYIKTRKNQTVCLWCLQGMPAIQKKQRIPGR